VNTAQMAAELALVRWPLRPLLDACDLTPTRLALLLGIPADAVRAASRRGLSDVEADLWATRAGYHPVVVWGWAWVDAATEPRPQRASVTASITAYLRARIEHGDLRPGDPLPSARHLADEWGVTTATVVRAIKVLHSEGKLIAAARGHRTLVAPPPARGPSCTECGASIEGGAEHFPHEPECTGADGADCSCDCTVHPNCCPTCTDGGQD
jgi:hypothetical protein